MIPRRRRARKTVTKSERVICYLRVSTDEQVSSGAGLEAQRAALERECQARGWQDVEWIIDAGFSAGSLNRPGMQHALAMLTSGEASTLAAAKLDRLSRSVIDSANLMALASEAGFALLILDLNIDTSTPSGRMIGNVMAAVAEWERDVIRERTRLALQARKAAGIKLGRKPILSPVIRESLIDLRASGMTYKAIAGRLNTDNVPTATGKGRWYPMTVYQALNLVS